MSATVRLEGKDARFPQWRELIAGLAAGRAIGQQVAAFLMTGDFESAASLVEKDRPNALSKSITDAFDRTVNPHYLTNGALSFLPYLTKGPVITTNYDRVLEQVFAAADKPFDTTIFGPRSDEIVSAVHANRHTLIKMHGDCRDRIDRVFTRESYEAAYGTATADAPLQGRIAGLAWLMFTNRPLLFISCSLEQDRTVGVLREIAHRVPGITHYAILAAEKSQDAWEARERQLDEIGVRGLWYYPGHYEEIETLLREALERSSTTDLVSSAPAIDSVVIQLADSPKTLEEIAAALPNVHPATKPFAHFPELDAIAREALSGKLTFFLGAYAGLDRSFLGAEFYDRLADEFKCPPALVGDRTAVAGYILTKYGPDRLWKAVSAGFHARAASPSAIHRLIAALPSLWRSRDIAATLCVVTTNYDTLMEQALTEAGELFRLLYYVDGPRGRPSFLERSPDGIVRQIDNPENLRSLGRSEHLIVKANGGLSYFNDMQEEAAVERGAFERLAALMPEQLPAYLRRELDARSMLFLGHGLAEPDVRRLIELYARSPGRLGSWAIQIRPSHSDHWLGWQEQVRIFAAQGLEIVEEDLTCFTAELIVRLQQLF